MNIEKKGTTNKSVIMIQRLKHPYYTIFRRRITVIRGAKNFIGRPTRNSANS